MISPEKSELFTLMIEKHKGIIYKVSNAFSKNREIRKDLTQEIILQLWKAFDNYNPQYKYSTWIYKISLNVSLAFTRKERHRAKMFDSLREDIVGFSISVESEEAETHIHQLHMFIKGLKELDRALLLLYLEEKSQKEMAEIMGLTETNISTRIGRIKSILKQKFSQLPQ